MIEIKLIAVGGKVEEYTFQYEPMLSELLSAAGKPFTNGCCTRNYSTINENTILRNGDKVLYGSAMKGNVDFVEIKLTTVGGKSESFAFQNEPKLSDLLRVAGKPFTNGCCTRNYENINENTLLYNGDKIYYGSAMKGNVPFEVKFIRIGGNRIISLTADDGYTIKQTLDQLDANERSSFYSEDGTSVYEYGVKDNNFTVGDNHVLQRPENGELRIVCSSRMKGNEII